MMNAKAGGGAIAAPAGHAGERPRIVLMSASIDAKFNVMNAEVRAGE
jgi:hypothetical protein